MPSGFQGLEVYQEARRLRQRIYKLARMLPDEEKYNLASQMRRAAVSMTNNIAEGHGQRSYKHNLSYIYRSRGSVNELIDDIGVCEDEGYFQAEHLADLHEHALRVLKLLNGYIAHLRRKVVEPSEP